jgi:hypothetical protein
MQQLPNGNVLLAWTDAGYFSEHTEDDQVLMEGRFLNKTRLGTYRMYKYTNWIGRPKQPPDVKAIGYGVGSSSMTAIYVSWNGATEHKTWKFFSDGELLGSVNKTGFETVFVTTSFTGMVRAEAFDINGAFLGKSIEVATEYPRGWVPIPADPALKEPEPILNEPESVDPVDSESPIAPIDPAILTAQTTVESDTESDVLTSPPKPARPISPPGNLAHEFEKSRSPGFSDPNVFTEPFYFASLVIPSIIGWSVIFRVVYRQLIGLVASQLRYSKGYIEIPI